MMIQIKILFITVLYLVFIPPGARDYPIDGYELTGIDRLLRLQRIMNGDIKGSLPPLGAQKSIRDIELNLPDRAGEEHPLMAERDPELQRSLNALFPRLNENYSISLLDVTPGREVRYAGREESRGYQPGSVGKLAVLNALFHELKTLYPNSFEKRRELLKSREVEGGSWVQYDGHTVPVYNPETGNFNQRVVREDDVFSLYEWTDHMVSVSNNGAASVVWREVILMRAFGTEYPDLTREQAEAYFSETSGNELSVLAMELVNEPLRKLGITKSEWRLGRLFTSGATRIVPPSGGSIGTTRGLMKFLIAMENGTIVDQKSSLEMKRLLYLTDRRIRYAASPALASAAVYYKSGSLYKCQPEEGFTCKKYMGNVYNYMNSVAIVEQPDGRRYLVCLMSNVLRKNSSGDHYELATKVDRLIKP